MPQIPLRNEEYRDELLKFSYPFDERSTLENDEVFIGSDLVLDAIIHLKEAAELPLHISQIDGTFGTMEEFRILISDDTGTIKARTDVHIDGCRSAVYNNENVYVGTVLYNEPGQKRFVGRIAGKLYTLLPGIATFALDATHVSKTPYLRYVKAADQAADGAVEIIARHGVQWVYDSETQKLSLDILGDAATNVFDRTPVRSVNGVVNRSIWLNAHPRANLRISTEDGTINFIAARDAT